MILVDTSIWIDHLRKGNDTLSLLLEQGRVLAHPFIIGELSCGSMFISSLPPIFRGLHSGLQI